MGGSSGLASEVPFDRHLLEVSVLQHSLRYEILFELAKSGADFRSSSSSSMQSKSSHSAVQRLVSMLERFVQLIQRVFAVP